jgi:hypothetical protein
LGSTVVRVVADPGICGQPASGHAGAARGYAQAMPDPTLPFRRLRLKKPPKAFQSANIQPFLFR